MRLLTSDGGGHTPGHQAIIMGPKVDTRYFYHPEFLLFEFLTWLDLCILASTKDVYEG